MDLYHVALFFHIVALLAAVMASSLVHFAMGRLHQAQRAPEALQWLGVIGRTTKVFPAAILTFFITGGYMISQLWSWRTSWIEAGVIGAIILLVNGIMVGGRMRPVAGMLVGAGNASVPDAARAAMNHPVVRTLPWVNTAVAFGVVFVMSTKPGVTGALATLATAIVAGLVVAARESAALRARASQVAKQEA